jgi:hypothetical protein
MIVQAMSRSGMTSFSAAGMMPMRKDDHEYEEEPDCRQGQHVGGDEDSLSTGDARRPGILGEDLVVVALVGC